MPNRSSLFVLLPPSEGKRPGGQRGSSSGGFGRSLGAQRRAVRTELGTVVGAASTVERSKLLGVRGELLERAELCTRAIAGGRPPVLPTWERYSGVVWEHLEPSTLDGAARERLLVPSGLYGVTSGVDLIADYRLKMSVRLGSLGVLAAYWRTPVTQVIARRCRGGVVVDLLPDEHRAAIDGDALARSALVIRVSFVTRDGRNAAGHAAKAVKGIVARRLIGKGLATMTGFEWEGWSARQVGDVIEIVAP